MEVILFVRCSNPSQELVCVYGHFSRKYDDGYKLRNSIVVNKKFTCTFKMFVKFLLPLYFRPVKSVILICHWYFFYFVDRVFYYVLTEKRRLLLSLYWISLIFVSVLKFYNISKHSKIERILLCKYYHLVAVLIFVPALLYEGILILLFVAYWCLYGLVVTAASANFCSQDSWIYLSAPHWLCF